LLTGRRGADRLRAVPEGRHWQRIWSTCEACRKTLTS
jgi:hypothetical protein